MTTIKEETQIGGDQLETLQNEDGETPFIYQQTAPVENEEEAKNYYQDTSKNDFKDFRNSNFPSRKTSDPFISK